MSQSKGTIIGLTALFFLGWVLYGALDLLIGKFTLYTGPFFDKIQPFVLSVILMTAVALFLHSLFNTGKKY